MFQEENSLSHLRFPQKLWYLLNDSTEAILWGNMGRTILLNYNILDRYLRCNQSIFKTTHISSFIRQLNLYGFRKVTSHLQDPLCNASNPDLHEYVHDFFQYGKSELLRNIKRKAWNLKKIKHLEDSNTLTSYHTSEVQIGRTQGSQRLQRARRMLQNALKRVTIPDYNLYTILDSHDENQISNELYEENSITQSSSQELPITWDNKHSDYFYPSSDNFHQNAHIQAIPSMTYMNSDNQDYSKQMNISSYIENFRVSDDFVGEQDSSLFYTSHEIIMGNEEEVQFETSEVLTRDSSTSQSNNNTIVVEIVDNNESKNNNEQLLYQGDWSHYSMNESITDNESSENKDLMTYEEVKLEERLNLEKILSDKIEDDYKDLKTEYSGGDSWEYCDILKDIVAKKDFPNHECGTELKELYTQISKTIDILNL